MLDPHPKQAEIIRSPARFKVIRAGRKGGKALSIETPILTTEGFKPLIDIRENDYVFNEEGKPVKVIYKSEIYYNRRCFEVKFGDAIIVADEEHDWIVEDKSYRKNKARALNTASKLQKKTTIELSRKIHYRNERNWSIPTTKPIQFKKRNLLVEPYFLGLWLGDGNKSNTGITTADKEVVKYLNEYAKRLNKYVRVQIDNRALSNTYYITGGKSQKRDKTLHGDLKKIGVLNNKHIPEEYLLSSINQRKQLLNGLMDSDGYISESGKCEYTSISKILAQDVSKLLCSFGIKNNVTESDSVFYGRIIGKRYRIHFTPYFNVCSLPRKSERQAKKHKASIRRRFIFDITEIETVPVQCLEVDSESHLFLAGYELIATHNTAMETEVISYKATSSAKRLKLTKDKFPAGRKIIYIAPTQIQARQIVWSSFKNRLDGLAKFNEQRLEIIIPNADKKTTTIMIGGWENRENYRGLTDVVHITFDEVDTFRNFFIDWKEIFRPMFLDTGGTATFIGTPKKESGNLKRLEKIAKTDKNYASFHFTSKDNPFLNKDELDSIELEYKDDPISYKQEILAEHIEDAGALFNFTALVDVFTNTVTKTDQKYLIVDIADDGTDKTIFSFWEGLEEYRREAFERMNTETIVSKIREYASADQIPYSQIAVDAIGVGAGVASSSMLDGIIGYKSSFSAIKTDTDIVKLPNASYLKSPTLVSDYKNLRSQCIFTLSRLINNHKLASRVSGEYKECTIEELNLYQDISQGDGKRQAMGKDAIKGVLGRSPDHSDTWIMRMYFEIVGKMLHSEEGGRVLQKQKDNFRINKNNFTNQTNK